MRKYPRKKNQASIHSQQEVRQVNSEISHSNSLFFKLLNTHKQQSIFCQNESPIKQRNPPREQIKEEKAVNKTNKTNQESQVIEKQQQVSSFKRRRSDHFNDYILIDNQVQNQKQQQNLTKTRNTRKSQHLKNISKYMMLLITHNKNLSVKEISYLLFEIIGETEFGKKLANQKKPLITSQTKRLLSLKYDDEQNVGAEVQKLIKNVRRRLYDALNVMISANIVSKSNKTIQMSNIQNAQSKKRQQIIQCRKLSKDKGSLDDAKQKLMKNIAQIQLNIQRKRDLLESMKKGYALQKKLVQKNQRNPSNAQQGKFQTPLTVIRGEPGMQIEIEEEKLQVNGFNKANFFSDMDIFKFLSKNNVQSEQISEKKSK